MAPYSLSDLALSDLADIRHHVAADNPVAADRLIELFFHRFDLIAKHPELGAAHPEFAGGDLRVHSVGSYAILYRTAEGHVEFARVLHGARDLESLLGS